MKSAIDTNVLLDLLAGDADAATAAQQSLVAASRAGALIICPVVYAELAAGFEDHQDLSRFLQELGVQQDGFSPKALWSASKAWEAYVRRRGQNVQCSQCGHWFDLQCPHCRSSVAWRQHLMSDFLIGAHAVTQAETLLTRDAGYYRTYFPQLRLIIPSS